MVTFQKKMQCFEFFCVLAEAAMCAIVDLQVFFRQVSIWHTEPVNPLFVFSRTFWIIAPHTVSTSQQKKTKKLGISKHKLPLFCTKPLRSHRESHLVLLLLRHSWCGTVRPLKWARGSHYVRWQSDLIQRLEAQHSSGSCTFRLRLVRLSIRGSTLPPCGQL